MLNKQFMQDEIVSLPALDPIAMYRTFEYRYRGTRRFIEGAESEDDQEVQEGVNEPVQQVVPQQAAQSGQID